MTNPILEQFAHQQKNIADFQMVQALSLVAEAAQKAALVLEDLTPGSDVAENLWNALSELAIASSGNHNQERA